MTAAPDGTELPTIDPVLYMTVLAVQVLGAAILVFATQGRLGYAGETGEMTALSPERSPTMTRQTGSPKDDPGRKIR